MLTKYDRLIPFAGLLLHMLLINTTVAQVIVWKPGQTDFESSQKATAASAERRALDTGTTNVLQRSITPAAEPVPALKYQFWQTASQRKPGNLNAMVSRALVLYLAHPNRQELDSQYVAAGEAWLGSPIDQQLREYLNQQKDVLSTLRVIGQAGSLNSDTTVVEADYLDDMDQMIVEVQNLRNLSRLLQLDTHVAVVDKRYADAMESITANVRLAEFAQASERPNLVRHLVSMAILGITLSTIDEFTQQPDAPNLYWALASVPDELWNTRRAIEGEQRIVSGLVSPLLDASKKELTEREWEEKLTSTVSKFFNQKQLLGGSVGKSNSVADNAETTARLVAASMVLLYGDRSATDLATFSIDSSMIDNMPAAQRVARAIALRWQTRLDELLKWSLIPSSGDYVDRYSKQLQESVRMSSSGFLPADPSLVMIGSVLPALRSAESATMRTANEHRLLLLREALRAYAATHAGSLPETLEALQPLPTLPDPQTRELFRYERKSESEAVIKWKPYYQGQPEQMNVRVVK